MGTLSRNEQIAVYILASAVILAVGLFVFLLPEINKIEPNKAIRDQRQAEFESLSTQFSLEVFEALEQDIINAYNDGKDASAVFYNDELRSYEADRLIQGILDDAKLDTDNLVINELSTHGLSLSVYRPVDILYGIKEKATIGTAEIPDPNEGEEDKAEGEEKPPPKPKAPNDEETLRDDASELLKKFAGASRQNGLAMFDEEMRKARNKEDEWTPLEVVEAMREFLAKESETVMSQNVKFQIELTKKQADDFAKHIYRLDEATYILDMSIATVGETSGNRQLYSIEIMFLIVQPMDEPTGILDYKEKFDW